MKLRPSLAGLVTLAAIGACAPQQLPPVAVEARPLGNSLPTREATQPPATLEDPTGDLPLRDALALALLHDPELATFSWELRAREAEALQSGVRPNPELGLELENFGGSGEASGFDGMETTLALSQLIELGGKRARRLQLATLDRDLAAWDYEAQRIASLNRTTLAYLHVLAGQEERDLAAQLVQLAEETVEAVELRLRAGGSSPVETSRARVALETNRIDLSIAERELQTRRRALAASWGGKTASFATASGSLQAVGDGVPQVDALQEFANESPEVARWTTELQRRRAVGDLARADASMDLSLDAGIRHLGESDDLGFVVGFSVPLRLYDRNRGSIRAAELRAQAGGDEEALVRLRVRQQISVQHDALAMAFDEILALREAVLPEAEQALELAREAYRQGRIRLTDVLDTQRTLFELRGRHIQALARYHGSLANLESLVGRPIGGTR